MNRRAAVLILLAAALPASAGAAGIGHFASANFDDALAADKPTLVHIDAEWCPTCRAQKPALDKLLADQRYAAFVAFRVDYDTEKPVLRRLSAPDRSTVIVFRGGKEVARSTGVTAEPALRELLDRAL